MAEFGPVLWVFLILFVLPFIDMLGFAASVGTTMMMADMGARLASSAMKGTDAANAAASVYERLRWCFILCNVTPVGGITDSAGNTTGITLAVQITSIGSSTPTTSYLIPTSGSGTVSANANANTPYSTGSITPYPTDSENPNNSSTTYTYQYMVGAHYQVMPLFNFKGANIAFLKNVPGLGAPITVQYTATSNVEHPEGLSQ